MAEQPICVKPGQKPLRQLFSRCRSSHQSLLMIVESLPAVVCPVLGSCQVGLAVGALEGFLGLQGGFHGYQGSTVAAAAVVVAAVTQYETMNVHVYTCRNRKFKKIIKMYFDRYFQVPTFGVNNAPVICKHVPRPRGIAGTLTFHPAIPCYNPGTASW